MIVWRSGCCSGVVMLWSVCVVEWWIGCVVEWLYGGVEWLCGGFVVEWLCNGVCLQLIQSSICMQGQQTPKSNVIYVNYICVNGILLFILNKEIPLGAKQ